MGHTKYIFGMIVKNKQINFFYNCEKVFPQSSGSMYLHLQNSSTTGYQLKPLSQSITKSVRHVLNVSEDNVVLEGEVLHVRIDAFKFSIFEDGESDVKNAVFVIRVLYDQEEGKEASLSSPHYGLCNLFSSLMEYSSAIGHDY